MIKLIRKTRRLPVKLKSAHALQPAAYSAALYISLKTEDVALFRFLLEGYDNLALFTVLERRPALLKIIFAPQSRRQVLKALAEINIRAPLTIIYE